MRNRNIKLNIFLNQKEKELLIFKAKNENLTHSEFIRKLIIDYSFKETTTENFSNMLKDIIKDLLILEKYLHNYSTPERVMNLDNNIMKLHDILKKIQ